ncbi:MAG: DegT/DnrJ/EryC1/StrS family aminotransferase, partial [Candidatus Omnitrophica bacterium]|nr:DegT/DnrJ/EryC1/StrS family aminotransferase [Candidatus Omnitrophota bacterium]
AVSLLDLPRGSEIIVPSFTWVSCAQAVLMAGHKPIFCDVDPITMNIRREDIEPFLKSSVKAIMVIHYAGLAVDLDPIAAFGLPVIEDAAHAVCSTYKGKPCGAITDVGIYSFDAIKNLTTGEGGGLVSRHAAWVERAKTLRYCGIGKSGFEAALADAKGESRWWEYNISEPFIKMLPTNIAAGIGLAQLDRIDALQAIRRDIWRYYQSEFGRMNWVTTPPEAKSGDKHSYFTYCIRVPRRDKLAHFLLEKEVYTTLRYHPLHMNPLYRQMDVRLPHCEALNEDALNIPLHPRLSSDDVNKIVDLIKEFGKINSL